MKKKLNDNKKTILIFIIIALIIILVGGSTFSYWGWRTNTLQRTNVSVTIEGGEMLIEGNNISKTGMYPTNDCDGTGALIGETVTVTATNKSEYPMQATLKINATLTTAEGELDTTKKEKINWAIIELASDAIEPIDNDCLTNSIASGTFATIDENNNIDTGITFDVEAKNTLPGAQDVEIKKYYKLYVWLDPTYEHKYKGNASNDPMRELQISVKWSEQSTLKHNY